MSAELNCHILESRQQSRRLNPSSSFIFLLALLLFIPQSAQAQTFTVLYTLAAGVDGSVPEALVRDNANNLYGLTSGGSFGYGTVFKLDASGQKSLLYTFTGGVD